MARQILIIGDIIETANDNIILAVDFETLKIRQEYSLKSYEEIRAEFKNKDIEVSDSNFKLKTKIVDVDVSSSLANFRNIFLKITKSSKTKRLKIKDEVIIDL